MWLGERGGVLHDSGSVALGLYTAYVEPVLGDAGMESRASDLKNIEIKPAA